jgi:periplasmic protein TonB
MSRPLLLALTLSTLLLAISCSSGTKPTAPQLARAGENGVTIPSCAYCPNPEYSEEARKAKLEGNVTVQAVVTADGRAENISVLQGLGSGLDQKAIDTVKTWRFNPALDSTGAPVPTQVPMQVSFKL